MVETAEIPAREGLLREDVLAFFVAFPSQTVYVRSGDAPDARNNGGPRA